MTSQTTSSQNTRYPKLFEPGKIAGMTIKNRIVLLPMGTFPAFSDELYAFYRERARGGTGILMMNRAKVSPLGFGGEQLESATQSSIWDDQNAEKWKRLAGIITDGGSRAVLQIDHDGIETGMRAKPAVQPIGPSAVSVPKHPVFRPDPAVARALTTQEVRDMVEAYVQASYRAQQFGWDGVQVYAGQGVLPMQFLSSRTNVREDEYGGSVENRTRFLLEILAGIKDACGRDFPVFVRLAADEGLEAGITVEEGSEIALLVDRSGDADAVDLSYGTHTSPVPMALPPPHFPEGALLDYVDRIHSQVRHMQLLAVGGIYTPGAAEQILASGRAELIGMGRALIADPYWPQKAMEGRAEDITTCIGCLTCFERSSEGDSGRRCSTNPIFGQESSRKYLLDMAPAKKRVIVVGGGPGGMEAAILAARRGHDVQLWEAAPALGGELISAAIPPHKERIGDYHEFMMGQLDKAGVRVELGRRANAENVVEAQADAVVVATGAKRRPLNVPGLDSNHVIHAIDLLEGTVEARGQKAVVVGGGAVGLETADYLADLGMEVVVVEMLPRLAPELHPFLRKWMQDRLRGGDCVPGEGLGVRLITNAPCDEVTESGVWIQHKDGDREFIEGNTVVVAIGQMENSDLRNALDGAVPELHEVTTSGRIFDAVHNAYNVAVQV